jgi:hypothetical protein
MATPPHQSAAMASWGAHTPPGPHPSVVGDATEAAVAGYNGGSEDDNGPAGSFRGSFRSADRCNSFPAGGAFFDSDDEAAEDGRPTMSCVVPGRADTTPRSTNQRPKAKARGPSSSVRSTGDAPRKDSANRSSSDLRRIGADKRERSTANGGSSPALLADMAMLSLTAVTVKKKLDFDEGPAQAEPWHAVNGGADDSGRQRVMATTRSRRDWMGASCIEEAMLRCPAAAPGPAGGGPPLPVRGTRRHFADVDDDSSAPAAAAADSDDDLAPPAQRKQHRREGGFTTAWTARQ